MNWKNAETEQPPENIPVFTWSKQGGMGMGMFAERQGSFVWHVVEGSALWHNGEKWDADVYYDHRYAPTEWHAIPERERLA